MLLCTPYFSIFKRSLLNNAFSFSRAYNDASERYSLDETNYSRFL